MILSAQSIRRLDWFMGHARHAATASKDTTQVGAALIGPEGECRLTAYNGPPRGVEDRAERFVRPTKYLFASHAETNLIAFAAREGIRTKDCAVFVTHRPCVACVRTMIQAGIRSIAFASGKATMDLDEDGAGTAMLTEAGIEVIQHEQD